MITDFDIHPVTGSIVLGLSSISGEMWLRLVDKAGTLLGEIPPEYLPQHARWSRDGTRVAFAGNDGKIFVYDLTAGRSDLVFGDPEFQAGFGEWSPNDSQLLFSAYRRPELNQKPPPDIYLKELSTGETRRLTDGADTVDRFPRWSPNGESVAFHRQHLSMTGVPKRICILELGDRTPVEVWSEPGNQEFGRFPWSRDGEWFGFCERRNDHSKFCLIDSQGREKDWELNGHSVKHGAFSPKADRLLCLLEDELVWVAWSEGQVVSRLSLPPGTKVKRSLTWYEVGFGKEDQVWFLDEASQLHKWDVQGECVVVHRHEEDSISSRVEDFTVQALDGLELPCKRLLPESPKRCAVLYVHGGPGGTLDPNDSWAQQLVAKGFEVIRVAYRGSSGYGERLQTAGKGEMGLADVSDVLQTGIHWVRTFGDHRSIALFGNSYGGFLSLLALAHPESPFAGAVCTCCAPSLENMRLWWDRGLPKNPKKRVTALKQRSVFAVAPRILKPVLLFHGALDTVATNDQVRQMAAEIDACKYRIFDDDTHSLQRHRQEIYDMTRDFFSAL